MLELKDSTRHRPFTSVMINGAETTALLDTAATIALIENRFFPPEETMTVEEETARILGLGGQRDYPIARVSDLQAGTEVWSDLRVAVNMERRFPVQMSIIPISMLDTRVVDFDFSNQRVLLYDESPKRIRAGRKSTLKYQDVDALMFIPIRINGVRGKALIDTGADISFVNQEYADRSRSRLDEKRTKIIQGSDLAKNWASIRTFKRLQIGAHSVDRLALPVVTTELFSTLGFSPDEPMMVLGMDILHQFRVQVDRETAEIILVNMSTTPQRSVTWQRRQY